MAKKKPNPDRWRELCESVKADDGLPTRESGILAQDKLYFWHRYLEITTTAMVGHPSWPAGLVYVDLFAGPGVCKIKNSQRRIPGSPLIAAYTPKEFRKILLAELEPANADACARRMQQSPAATRFQMFVGDCNEMVDAIAKEIPRGALTLAFVDPTSLHAKLSTLKRLSESGRVDLLILFPDAINVIRNVDYYLPDLDSNLDLVLGSDSGWREAWQKLGSQDGPNARQLFARLYQDQLAKHAKYVKFGTETISGPQGPLYRLVYASKHRRGLDFWEKAQQKEVSGQKRISFD